MSRDMYAGYFDPPDDDFFEAMTPEEQAAYELEQAALAEWEAAELNRNREEWIAAGQACKQCHTPVTEGYFYFSHYCAACIEKALADSYELAKAEEDHGALEYFTLIELDPKHPDFPTFLPDVEIADDEEQ